MVRAFLTGGSGFVGRWLRAHLAEEGDEVTALSATTDLRDGEAVRKELVDAAPEVVYHLAALTHVGRSWEDPAETFAVNAAGTLNLLQAARSCEPPPRLVVVSSAEVYGAGTGQPIDEDAPLAPVTPYAASKAAAEFLAVQAHLGYGLQVVRTRPFNHVGPGQAEFFVISGLAKRVAEAEAAGGGVVRVGNLAVARDFTDVRDVVRAYRLLAVRGEAGEVYNVCSGEARTIAQVLEELVALARHEVSIEQDPALFRPVDVPELVGDCSRIGAATGWRSEISFSKTLVDVLADWRAKLGGPAGATGG